MQTKIKKAKLSEVNEKFKMDKSELEQIKGGAIVAVPIYRGYTKKLSVSLSICTYGQAKN